MYWNHRVFKTKTNYNTEEVYLYTIHEVYYDEDDSIEGWIDREEEPFGETLEELKQTLEWMRGACDKPVIDRAELEAETEYKINNPRYGPEEPVESYDSMEEFLEALNRMDDDGGNIVERP